MTYNMLYEKVLKLWSNTNDIMIIANCGRNSAIKIRQSIETQIEKEGKKLPQCSPLVIPTKRVLDHLGLDERYIFEMAMNEKRMGIGG